MHRKKNWIFIEIQSWFIPGNHNSFFQFFKTREDVYPNLWCNTSKSTTLIFVSNMSIFTITFSFWLLTLINNFVFSNMNIFTVTYIFILIILLHSLDFWNLKCLTKYKQFYCFQNQTLDKVDLLLHLLVLHSVAILVSFDMDYNLQSWWVLIWLFLLTYNINKLSLTWHNKYMYHLLCTAGTVIQQTLNILTSSGAGVGI